MQYALTPAARGTNGAMMRSLDPHQAWRQLLEKRQDMPAPQLTAYDHLAGYINAVHLEDRLRDIQTDRRN
jgi:hypothetical protein